MTKLYKTMYTLKILLHVIVLYKWAFSFDPKRNHPFVKDLHRLALTSIHSLKASQMGHFVMVSLWCASLSTNTRFRFLYFRMKNC